MAHLTGMGPTGKEQRSLLLKGDKQEAGSTSAELASRGGAERQKPRKKQRRFHLRKGRTGQHPCEGGRCWQQVTVCCTGGGERLSGVAGLVSCEQWGLTEVRWVGGTQQSCPL